MEWNGTLALYQARLPKPFLKMSFQNRIVESILCIALAGGVRGLGLLVVFANFRFEITFRESVAGAGRAGVQPFLCEEGGDARARQAQPRARNGIHPPLSTPGRGENSPPSPQDTVAWFGKPMYRQAPRASRILVCTACIFSGTSLCENLHDVFAARHAWSQQNFSRFHALPALECLVQ